MKSNVLLNCYILYKTLRYRRNHKCCASRSDHTHEEKESTIEELVREITALWQTDELRRKKPSALDGMHFTLT